jgi:hypothetical protein
VSWNQIPAETHRRVAPLEEETAAADFCPVAAHDLPGFDPRVLERSAEAAYRRANAIFTGCVAGGYVVGDTRSTLCRLQGQTALAQVESAKHARAMADAMREIHEIHARVRDLTAPASVPVPALRVAAAGGSDVKPPPVSS